MALGRVVLTKELRDVLNINIKDAIEVFMEGEYIILKKYESGCKLSDRYRNLITTAILL